MRFAIGLSLCVLACACEPAKKNAPAPEASSAAPAGSAPSPVTRHPAPRRIVAVGDVHGDLAATRAVLRLAGVIDENDRWSGGDTVLVQTGDVLDRGDGEQAIVDLLLALEKEAEKAGGKAVLLNGNHELMNVAGDYRYVTPGGFQDFTDAPGVSLSDPALAGLPQEQRARAAAFRPGGSYARKLALHPIAVVVGDTAFAHGGILPKYARDIERLNREVAAWFLGIDQAGMRLVSTTDSPVWSRHYSDEPDDQDCKLLEEALGLLEAKRMVVGHTVQPGIRSACSERVWRIDVGMAAHYGGKPEALEITKDGTRILK
jgi:hypothetical protein